MMIWEDARRAKLCRGDGRREGGREGGREGEREIGREGGEWYEEKGGSPTAKGWGLKKGLGRSEEGTETGRRRGKEGGREGGKNTCVGKARMEQPLPTTTMSAKRTQPLSEPMRSMRAPPRGPATMLLRERREGRERGREGAREEAEQIALECPPTRSSLGLDRNFLRRRGENFLPPLLVSSSTDLTQSRRRLPPARPPSLPPSPPT
jgi:hypothetical protein